VKAQQIKILILQHFFHNLYSPFQWLGLSVCGLSTLIQVTALL